MPQEGVKKGENGRVLVLGGSKLFHAASFWSAGMASRLVDLVHFSSPAMENNELMRVRAKSKFWEGIVVPWEEVEHYIEEDDVVLIGPGMPRDEGLMEGERATGEIVNELLAKYPDRKWVVDGGALQEVDVNLLTSKMIITPNKRELAILYEKSGTSSEEGLAKKLGVMVLSKGRVDVVTDGKEKIEITGGSAGMVKGGTGDVLSGLVAGLYAKNPAMESAVVASKVCKRAGEKLATRVGPYFSASELMSMVPELLWEMLKTAGLPAQAGSDLVV